MTSEVTSTLTVQLPLAGMIAPDNETEPDSEVTLPDAQLVVAFGVPAVIRFVG